MKNIDIKSLIIGALLTSTIFLGVASTSVDDKWDYKQVWRVDYKPLVGVGWEPFAVTPTGKAFYRKRIK